MDNNRKGVSVDIVLVGNRNIEPALTYDIALSQDTIGTKSLVVGRPGVASVEEEAISIGTGQYILRMSQPLCWPKDLRRDISFLEANHDFLAVIYGETGTAELDDGDGNVLGGLRELTNKSAFKFTNLLFNRARMRAVFPDFEAEPLPLDHCVWSPGEWSSHCKALQWYTKLTDLREIVVGILNWTPWRIAAAS